MMGKLFSGAKRALSGNTFFVTTFANAGERAAGRRVLVALSGQDSAGRSARLGRDDHRAEGLRSSARRAASTSRSRSRAASAPASSAAKDSFFSASKATAWRSCTRRARCTRSSSQPGESLRVDTGCIVAMEERVDYDIQMVPGIKTALFGGEGLFFARLRGPGRVMLQTMPFSRLADRILAAAPAHGGHRRDRATRQHRRGGTHRRRASAR